jgi:hypothetical protein
MSGVFISHSSQDKKFVAKLAVDLTVRGIPVWYDSWEMEVGDKLYDRIFTGIDESTILILALSPASINSKWVVKELNAALAKEDRLGRKVIIPIKIAACDVPLAIADRIYADFSQDYLRALESLEKVLRNSIGGNLGAIPLEKTIIALTFSRGLFLDPVGLQKQYERLAPTIINGGKIVSEQIVIAPDHRLDRMRDVMLHTIETYEERKDYQPDTERYLRSTYESLRKAEAALVDGVVDIANGIVNLDWASFADACHWYSRIIRNEILLKLVAVWHFSRPDEVPPLGEGAVLGPISSNNSAAEFFGTKDVRLVDIFDRDTHEYFKAWIGEETEPYREPSQFQERLFNFWAPDLLYKYIVPQMVAKYRFYNAYSGKMFWDLPNKIIGPA